VCPWGLKMCAGSLIALSELRRRDILPHYRNIRIGGWMCWPWLDLGSSPSDHDVGKNDEDGDRAEQKLVNELVREHRSIVLN
jgi:hypothetical protein